MTGSNGIVTGSARLEHETADFWRAWVRKSTYAGRWREMVTQAGGERNWDYRYTWIRDGSFSLYALLGLGYVGEARAFAGWLRDRAEETPGRRRPSAEDHVPGRRCLGPD